MHDPSQTVNPAAADHSEPHDLHDSRHLVLSKTASLKMRSFLGSESINRCQYQGQLRQQSLRFRRIPETSQNNASSGKLVPHLSLQQLADLDLLLECSHSRAVYIVGHSHVRARQERQHPVRGYLKGLVMSVYSLIDNNTQPATAAWKLPDDQLLEVKLLVRV
jgi:hypothetical protein